MEYLSLEAIWTDSDGDISQKSSIQAVHWRVSRNMTERQGRVSTETYFFKLLTSQDAKKLSYRNYIS